VTKNPSIFKNLHSFKVIFLINTLPQFLMKKIMIAKFNFIQQNLNSTRDHTLRSMMWTLYFLSSTIVRTAIKYSTPLFSLNSEAGILILPLIFGLAQSIQELVLTFLLKAVSRFTLNRHLLHPNISTMIRWRAPSKYVVI
jgi:hypothetical protein